MGRGKKLLTVLAVLIFLFNPASVFANATPVYLENYPAFTIAPVKDSPLIVDREKLTFQIDERVPEQAMVTAGYTLSNTSGEKVTVPMVFPFISTGYRGYDTSIHFDGQAVDYKIYSAGHVQVMDYLREPEEFNRQAHIDTIIENLNQPPYQARFFDDAADAVIYEVTFAAPVERQVKINFSLDPDRTRVLAYGFNGFEMDQRGKCAVFTYVREKGVGEKAYLAVLGEDTLRDISSDHDDVITKSQVNTGDFILGNIAGSQEGYYLKNRDMNNMYSLYIQQIDNYFGTGQTVFEHYMVLEDMMSKNNIAVLLYEVEFAPHSTKDLVITYPMWATIDRQNSNHYVNTFAYLLNPARNFSAFGGLDIHIELNSAAPFIIESSMPLKMTGEGVYSLSLEGLPAEDLVFSTYPQEEITFWDTTTARIWPPGYGRVFAGFGAAGFLGVALMASMYCKRKRKYS